MKVLIPTVVGSLFIVAVVAALAGLASWVWAGADLDQATGLHLDFGQFFALFVVLRFAGLSATYKTEG